MCPFNVSVLILHNVVYCALYAQLYDALRFFCAFDMLDVCCIALKGVAASEQLVKEYGLVCG